jgi:hypothetical protein
MEYLISRLKKKHAKNYIYVDMVKNVDMFHNAASAILFFIENCLSHPLHIFCSRIFALFESNIISNFSPRSLLRLRYFLGITWSFVEMFVGSTCFCCVILLSEVIFVYDKSFSYLRCSCSYF